MTDPIEEAMFSAGYDGLTRALKIALREYLELWKKKQADYSPDNISLFMERGCVIRACDKLMRLKNHYFRDAEMKNESVEDSWMDLCGYSLIGLVCERGQWPSLELKNVLDELDDNSTE